MTRSITNDEYQLLKKFLDIYFRLYMSKNLPSTQELPSDFLKQIEMKSLTNAKRGLQMAINDIVEETIDWPLKKIIEINERLSNAGTFTLSKLHLTYSNKCQKIINKGVIRNEVEYYLIKGVLDGALVKMGTTEAVQLQAMLDNYENKSP